MCFGLRPMSFFLSYFDVSENFCSENGQKGSGFPVGVFFEHLVFFPSSSSLFLLYGYEIPFVWSTAWFWRIIFLSNEEGFSVENFFLWFEPICRESLFLVFLCFLFWLGKLARVWSARSAFDLPLFVSGKLSGEIPGSGGFSAKLRQLKLRQEVRSPVTCRDTWRETAGEVTNGTQCDRLCDHPGIPNGLGIRKVRPDQGAGRSLGRVEIQVDRAKAWLVRLRFRSNPESVGA